MGLFGNSKEFEELEKRVVKKETDLFWEKENWKKQEAGLKAVEARLTSLEASLKDFQNKANPLLEDVASSKEVKNLITEVRGQFEHRLAEMDNNNRGIFQDYLSEQSKVVYGFENRLKSFESWVEQESQLSEEIDELSQKVGRLQGLIQRVDLKRRDKCRELYLSGKNPTEISRMTGLSRPTVYAFCAGLPAQKEPKVIEQQVK